MPSQDDEDFFEGSDIDEDALIELTEAAERELLPGTHDCHYSDHVPLQIDTFKEAAIARHTKYQRPRACTPEQDGPFKFCPSTPLGRSRHASPQGGPTSMAPAAEEITERFFPPDNVSICYGDESSQNDAAYDCGAQATSLEAVQEDQEYFDSGGEQERDTRKTDQWIQQQQQQQEEEEEENTSIQNVMSSRSNRPFTPLRPRPASPAKNEVVCQAPSSKTKKRHMITFDSHGAVIPTQPKISGYMAVSKGNNKRPKLSHPENPEKMKPFVRPRFPPVVSARSPVDGLSSHTVIKTCFRIGEALKAAYAGKAGAEDVLIELYGRVSFSERTETKQNFQFLDLFHDRPPFLSGSYEYWKRHKKWNEDSAAFLFPDTRPKLARTVGRLVPREGAQGGGYHMQIMNVRPVEWEDVEQMREIICGKY